MGNKKLIPFFLLASIGLTYGCQGIQNNASSISDKIDSKQEKVITQYSTISDVLSSKNFDIATYKEFIGNLIIQAYGEDNVSDKEIDSRIALNDNKVFEKATDTAIASLRNSTKQSIALQKLIDSSVSNKDLSAFNRADYLYSYLIIYYTTSITDDDVATATALDYIDKYVDDEKFYSDSPLNYGVFTSLINKENNVRVNGSYNIAKTIGNNSIRKLVTVNEYGKDVTTYFKKIKTVENNNLYIDKLMYLESFKKATLSDSKQETFINMVKYIVNSSPNINITNQEYAKLLSRLNEFDTENIQEMINHFIDLYITDYSNINENYKK